MIEDDSFLYGLVIKIDSNFKIIGTDVQSINGNESISLSSFQCPACFQKIFMCVESLVKEESVDEDSYQISEEFVEELHDLGDDCMIDTEAQDALEIIEKTEELEDTIESNQIFAKYICEVCNEEFQSQHTFRLHKNIHTDKFSCELCQQGFANNTLLAKHKKRNHAPENLNTKKKKLEENLSCPKCGRTFNAKVSLRLHMNTHSDKFRCNIKSCLKGFPNNSRLRRHLKSIHGVVEANEVAEQKFYDSEYNHNMIAYEISSDNGISLLPSIIYEDIDIIKEREQELQKQESVKKTFVCETCGKVYSSNTACFIHKQNHKPPKFECHYCGKRMHRKVILKKHIITQHIESTVPEFVCKICQKKFFNKYSLIAHARVHQDPKYLCDICFTRFKQSSSLKDHMRIHGGQKPFKCSRCSRTFTTKWALKSHEMIYSGEKNHVCNICSKAFSRKSYLTAHLKIHEKPFICLAAGCGDRFVEVNELKRHKLIHKQLETQVSGLTTDSSEEEEVDTEMYYEIDV